MTKSSLAEKIYLQIDNTLYQTGERIWFKAIVSKSYDNSLSDVSEILHVELIDSNEAIIEKKLLKLKSGTASGNFELQKSYKTGKYLIRAYTNWNRNFQEDFMFSQSIDVFNLDEKVKPKNPIINVVVNTGEDKILTADINPRVINPRHKGDLKLYIDTGNTIDSVELNKTKEGIYKLNYTLPENTTQTKLSFNKGASGKIFEADALESYSKTIVIDKDYLDVQFFPEGGKLVNNLLSTVAFKAIDYQGLGYKISGQIKNGQGNAITSFNSNKLGIGTFKLLPKVGNNYYAEVSMNDVVYKYNLPKAKNTGSVLSVVRLKDDIRILLASNKKTEGDIRIQTESRGVKYHDLSFENKDAITTSISSKSLPEGIVKISVIDDNKRVISERLIFNTKPSNRLTLDIKSDRDSYSQREKTSLKIKLDSLQAPEGTSLSVLVIDKERVDASRNYKSNLTSHLLLSSELKGFIENPSYYFDSTNYDSALDLDALLLSQGWRTYKYQKTSSNTYYAYKPEKRLVVSGTIGEYFNPKKRPKKPLDLNMFVYGEPVDVYKQEIDSSGRYRFEIEDIYKPNTELFMQVVDKKGKPIDFGINIDKKWNPKIEFKQERTVELPSEIVSTFTEREETNNKIQRDFEVAHNTVALDEVNIKGYKLTPERVESIERNGEPSAVIEGEELRKKAPKREFGIYSVLEAMYPNLVRIERVGRYGQVMIATVVGSDLTLVLLDGKPVHLEDYRYLANIPINDIESIDLIKKAKRPSQYLGDVWYRPLILNGTAGDRAPKVLSYIHIYTFSKNGINKNTDLKGVLTNTIKGFSESVEFYTPNYETLSNQDWVIPDNRSVIHWSPNITLDANGEYILEYYNDDHVGEVSVIVEAISKDGKIGYVEKTYTIKEAER
ncbi:MG2 domain-containing protein [Winogradskyella sp. R77965]|uniref:MG2 domain-containing protein n=1 Tax=Winogradskyella sp. R77965 TaxID=3093872 RepID=UPI0037DC7E80